MGAQVDWHDYEPQDLERLESDVDRSISDKRGPFERDRARIIHSAAFRRLQGKTQVYGLGASDYYRTRLTHSLEVAQIAKALALLHGADAALVEAISLAHDIGHPPFGHAGEEALHAAMLDFDGFNGNAQNLRIVVDTEKKSLAYRGLNLTKATLDGLLKYKWPISQSSTIPLQRKKGYYKGDEHVARAVIAEDRQTFECQIMNWSDDVAYSAHDLEDALVIGTVRRDDLESSERADQILSIASESYGLEYSRFEERRQLRRDDVTSAISPILDCLRSDSKRIERIKDFVARHISDCVLTTTRLENNHHLRRYRYSLKLNEERARIVEIYKAITFACVIKTNPVLTLQEAGKTVVRDLYETYANGRNKNLRYFYPADWADEIALAQEQAETGDDPTAIKRVARDYIASMTDKYAEQQWRRLKLPGEGGLFVARA